MTKLRRMIEAAYFSGRGCRKRLFEVNMLKIIAKRTRFLYGDSTISMV